MDEFLPYSRLIDRMAYQYTFSRKAFGVIVKLMAWHDDGMRQFTGYHKHAKAHEIEEKLGRKAFESYFSFAFVRNPFDFLVSLYFYMLQSKNSVFYNEISQMSFVQFLRWHIASNPPQQIDFLMDRSRSSCIVDCIGRFETLAKDVNSIKSKLNLEFSNEIRHNNPSLYRINNQFMDYYDDEARNLVVNYFQPDLQMLGYDFSGYSERIPLLQNL